MTGKYNLEKRFKSNINYQLLLNNQLLYDKAAQQTIRGVAEAFKSYKELSKKYSKAELAAQTQLPKYRKKVGMGVITYPKQALKLDKSQVRVPLGKKVKTIFKIDSFFLDFPSNLEGSSKQVVILEIETFALRWSNHYIFITTKIRYYQYY